jgi:hypothetical protein
MTPQGKSGLYGARKSEAGGYEIRAVSSRGEGYYEKANSFRRNSFPEERRKVTSWGRGSKSTTPPGR